MNLSSSDLRAGIAAEPVAADGGGRLQLPEGWSAGELHVHTSHSDGTRTLEQILSLAERLGLDTVAVTDHDKVNEGLRAVGLAARYRTSAVAGTEVTTRTQHHVLGLFVERPVPLYRSMADSVRAIRDQGGLAILAHPFMAVPNASGRRRILGWLEQTDFDGIELENQYLSPERRERLRAFYDLNRERLGAAIGGTDAHFGDLGRFLTLYPGRGPEDLYRAIKSRQTVAARSDVSYPRAGLGELALNNYRSLACMSVYRLRALLLGRYE
ncbi:MAG: PHP domain-containing protein [Chloroflexi bacterium]|nr:PHP domain-containing protein [Chloroflexota bacterium]